MQMSYSCTKNCCWWSWATNRRISRDVSESDAQDGQDSGDWFLVSVVVNLGRCQVERTWRQEDSTPTGGRLHGRRLCISQQHGLPGETGISSLQKSGGGGLIIESSNVITGAHCSTGYKTNKKACYRRENRYTIEFCNGIVRFPCNSTLSCCSFVCRLQWM